MIELNQLVKNFGDLVAVNNVSLKIARGEFFAMLGPNAAGKTTTIKLLAGLIKPTSGSARICGFDVQLQPLEARRRLAYVPDFPFLYDKLTAWEFFLGLARLGGYGYYHPKKPPGWLVLWRGWGQLHTQLRYALAIGAETLPPTDPVVQAGRTTTPDPSGQPRACS